MDEAERALAELHEFFKGAACVVIGDDGTVLRLHNFNMTPPVYATMWSKKALIEHVQTLPEPNITGKDLSLSKAPPHKS